MNNEVNYKEHNEGEWESENEFQTQGNEECMGCDKTLEEGEKVWVLSQFRGGKWETMEPFCQECKVVMVG